MSRYMWISRLGNRDFDLGRAVGPFSLGSYRAVLTALGLDCQGLLGAISFNEQVAPEARREAVVCDTSKRLIVTSLIVSGSITWKICDDNVPLLFFG